MTWLETAAEVLAFADRFWRFVALMQASVVCMGMITWRGTYR